MNPDYVKNLDFLVTWVAKKMHYTTEFVWHLPARDVSSIAEFLLTAEKLMKEMGYAQAPEES